MPAQTKKELLAYITGIALGDGNLSNPNGRAVRLRITCDTKYPGIIKKIYKTLTILFPHNKVAIIKGGKKSYVNISCYSNKLEKLLGWQAKGGSKYIQKVSIPEWIKKDKIFSTFCLQGLLETDGSLYRDRGYLMANFVTTIPTLANDVVYMINQLGFFPHLYKITTQHKLKHTIRISKRVEEFSAQIGFKKF